MKVEDVIWSHKKAVDLAEGLTDEIECLQAEAAAMREALEAIEWIFRTGTGYCPWCGKPFKSGHAPDCQRQLALSADGGREMLERLRRAKQECDQWRTICEVLSAIDAVKVGMLERLARAEREWDEMREAA